jgi:hypothetical protein
MLAKNGDAISIAIPSEQGSDGTLVETCDLVESALAKKLIQLSLNESLPADISNEVVPVFRSKAARSQFENFIVPGPSQVNPAPESRSAIIMCKQLQDNRRGMNTYTKRGEGWQPPNPLVGPRFRDYSSSIEVVFGSSDENSHS